MALRMAPSNVTQSQSPLYLFSSHVTISPFEWRPWTSTLSCFASFILAISGCMFILSCLFGGHLMKFFFYVTIGCLDNKEVLDWVPVSLCGIIAVYWFFFIPHLLCLLPLCLYIFFIRPMPSRMLIYICWLGNSRKKSLAKFGHIPCSHRRILKGSHSPLNLLYISTYFSSTHIFKEC
jgi:hypothetical protein